MVPYVIQKEYFTWMCKLVCANTKRSYKRLFRHLDSIDFVYILEKDRNRAQDGIDLRYRFGYEFGYSRETIKECVDIRECSVFEMMVALAFRCEEHIMCDAEYGDRTSEWFFEMIRSLDLENMYDARYNELYVDEVIDIFLNRSYTKNGKGGLFMLKDPNIDARNVEIWYQMCYYLRENY